MIRPNEVGAPRPSLVIDTGPTATVDRSGDPSANPGRNTRLMVQIGVLLGLAYLAFLAVWFWTTRFRARPHPPERA